MSQETIIIKKYANRRLYDTQTSSYITQEDLLEMSKNGDIFEVKDAKTGEDLTRQVLTQIIFEEESKKTVPLLPVSFLRRLIKMYDNSLSSSFPQFIEQTIESFNNMESNRLNKVEEVVQKNMEMFTSSMQMLNPFFATNSGLSKEEKIRKIKELEKEIESLKKDLG